MQHRHLNHERLTLAAIDDRIARGRWDDWAVAIRGERVATEPNPGRFETAIRTAGRPEEVD